MKNATDTATSTKQIDLTRRSPNYWRVTLDHPPLNIFSCFLHQGLAGAQTSTTIRAKEWPSLTPFAS
jgi:hypothetical protein